MTDASGNIVDEQRYMPYGQPRLAGDDILTDRLFTGQRDVPSIDLMDYNARMYSPSLGRFIQPDTIVPDMFNPQSLNRYSYVLNNPIRYTDPTGHYCEDEVGNKQFNCNKKISAAGLGFGSAGSGLGSNNPVPTSTPNPFAVVVPSGVATPEFQGTPVPYLTQTEYSWEVGQSYWVYGEFPTELTDENSIEIPFGYLGDPGEVSAGGWGITVIDPLDDAIPGLEEGLTNFQSKYVITSKSNLKIQEFNLIVSKTQYDSHYIAQTSYTTIHSISIIVNVQPIYKQNLPFIEMDFYLYSNSPWKPIP